jgi:hypothetical protein
MIHFGTSLVQHILQHGRLVGTSILNDLAYKHGQGLRGKLVVVVVVVVVVVRVVVGNDYLFGDLRELMQKWGLGVYDNCVWRK